MLLETSIPLRADGTVIFRMDDGTKYVFRQDASDATTCDVPDEDAVRLIRTFGDVQISKEVLIGSVAPTRRGRPPKKPTVDETLVSSTDEEG